jgi:hypothetical protein
MTLKEKLCEPLGKFYIETSKELEEIADEYAIGFVKWVVSPETSDLLHDLEIVGEIDENITPEQLLEIYKKEKGL